MIDDRWSAYLDNTVAVVIDGARVDLTGPGAIEEWPFDGSVQVLTAWDPSGRTLERSENDRANAALRADLTTAGGEIHDSTGHAGPVDDDTFIDAGFVVGGLDEPTVVELALRYDQEAIYTLTAHELVLVATRSDRRDSRPRLALREAT